MCLYECQVLITLESTEHVSVLPDEEECEKETEEEGRRKKRSIRGGRKKTEVR